MNNASTLENRFPRIFALQSWLIILLIFSAGLALQSLWQAFSVKLFLLNDGALWVRQILSKQEYVGDSSFTRYSNIILEAPALLLFKLSRSNILASQVVAVLSACFTFHILISFAWCVFILKRKDRLDLLVFVAMLFATINLPGVFYFASAVPISLSFFWPFALAILVRPRLRVHDSLTLLLGAVGLAFGHESTIFGLFAISVLLAWRLRVEKGADLLSKLALMLTLALQAWLAYRTLGPTAGTHVYFIGELKRPWPWTRWAFFVSTVGYLAVAVAVIKHRAWNPKANLVGGLTLFAVVILEFLAVTKPFNGDVSISIIYSMRTTSFAITAVALVILAIFEGMSPLSQTNKTDAIEFQKWGLILLSVALITGANYVSTVSNRWSYALNKLENDLSVSPGCKELSSDEIRHRYGADLLQSWTIHDLAILVQGDRSVTSLVYQKWNSEDSSGRRKSSPCEAVSDGILAEFASTLDRPMADSKTFDFTPLIEASQRKNR